MGLTQSAPIIQDDSSEYEDEEEPYSSSTSEEEVRSKLSRSCSEASLPPGPPYSDNMSGSFCLDSTTDATSGGPSIKPFTITLEQVFDIEFQLDLFEKVSLVYLLYESPSQGLREVNYLLRGNNTHPLQAWAHQQGSKWQGKVIEALCVIQNFKVLKGCGHDKMDLMAHFCPRQPFVAVHVDKFRKHLYSICENFVQKDTRGLIDAVNRRLPGGPPADCDPNYLESYLLAWETLGWLRPENLSEFLKVLKQLEHFDICDELEREFPVPRSPVRPPERPNVYDKILDDCSSLADLMSLEASSSADNFMDSRSKSYEINPRSPGVCLIINQENFYTERNKAFGHLLPTGGSKLEFRTGTKKDRDVLETTFKAFNFRTVVKDDLDHEQIIKVIEDVVKSVQEEETSLFVCIMSHGDKGVVYGVNSCHVVVEDIQNVMCQLNKKKLLGKPKVLILQSCQGTKCQKIPSIEEGDEIVTDGISTNQAVPTTADMLTFWATVPGFGAIRNKRTGSWFIQSLCQKMRDLSNTTHLEDICTSIVDDVTQKKWAQKGETVAMVPMKVSTLRKHLFLPKLGGCKF